jgi:hypothetical protein
MVIPIHGSLATVNRVRTHHGYLEPRPNIAPTTTSVMCRFIFGSSHVGSFRFYLVLLFFSFSFLFFTKKHKHYVLKYQILFCFEICSVLQLCSDLKFVRIHFSLFWNLLSFKILSSFEILSNLKFILFLNLLSFKICLNSNFDLFWNLLSFKILFGFEIYFKFKFCSILKFAKFPLEFVQIQEKGAILIEGDSNSSLCVLAKRSWSLWTVAHILLHVRDSFYLFSVSEWINEPAHQEAGAGSCACIG